MIRWPRLDRSSLKPALFVLWAALMATSLTAALSTDGQLDADGEAIAAVVARQGQVELRPEGSVVWTSAAKDQGLTEGTVVATGAQASAQVEFKDGRTLDVGENSQIALSRGQAAGGSGYLVTLLKGSLKVVTAAPAPGALATLGLRRAAAPLAIRAGRQELALASGKEAVAVQKELKSEAVVQVTSGRVAVKSTVGSQAAVVLTPRAESYELNLVLPRGLASAAKAAKAAKAAPAPHPAEAVASAAPAPVPPPAPPPAQPTVAKVVQARRPLVRLAALKPPPVVVLPAQKPMSTTTPPKKAHGVLWAVLDGKAALPSGLPDGAAAAPRRSFSALPDGPVAVALGSLRTRSAASYVYQPRVLGPEQAPIIVHLATSRDLPRLVPLLTAQEAFGVEPETAQVAKGDGLYVVRDGRLVARVDLRGPSAGALPRVAGLLGASLAFVGQGAALHPARELGSLASGEGAPKLLLLRAGRLVPIDRRLLRAFPDAAAGVAAMAELVFTEPVQLVVPRVGTADEGPP